MSKRHTVYVCSAAAILIGAIVLLTWPLAGALFQFAVVESLDPGAISWDGKTAWRRCDSALANRTTWPASAQAACAAMYLCANEAPLNGQQMDVLREAIRTTPGCPAL